MAAIALGVWAAFFMSGFVSGMIRSYINNAVDHVVSHIQIHHPEFKKDYEARFRIEDPDRVVESIRAREHVIGVSARAVVNGMISSPQGTRGIQVKAVNPEPEASVTQLPGEIREGTYFEGDRKNQVLISTSLAEKLKVKVRSKLVITFQDLDLNITAGAFRVVGLFDTGNQPYDEATIFVLRKDLDRLLLPQMGEESQARLTSGQPTPESLIAHEIAILLDDSEAVEAVKAEIEGQYPELLVETYREISPDLRLYESQFQVINSIYLIIILLALIFGIINTMLMAVLERVRELGMLMAIGMNKGKVFLMIMLETILLSMAGLPFGLLLGHLTVRYFGEYGLNLSMYSDSLKQFGMSDMVYFEVDPSLYYLYPIGMAITAVLASVYPAYRAIRLRPVEAIRKI
jgi:ABC-type lipoprotein release transport system permease subunit